MASKVTPEDIKKFNQLYYEYHNFAKIARETGFSSSTVSKYVDKNWKPVDATKIKRFTLEQLPPTNLEWVKNYENLGDVCILSDNEKTEIKELWEELEC